MCWEQTTGVVEYIPRHPILADVCFKIVNSAYTRTVTPTYCVGCTIKAMFTCKRHSEKESAASAASITKIILETVLQMCLKNNVQASRQPDL